MGGSQSVSYRTTYVRQHSFCCVITVSHFAIVNKANTNPLTLPESNVLIFLSIHLYLESETMSGHFPRLNGEMAKGKEALGKIFSIVGEMVSCDGTYLTLKASDGVPLIYTIPADFNFEQGRVVEVMGALSSDPGTLNAFISRDLGMDFDLKLYNDFITKVLPQHERYFS